MNRGGEWWLADGGWWVVVGRVKGKWFEKSFLAKSITQSNVWQFERLTWFSQCSMNKILLKSLNILFFNKKKINSNLWMEMH